MLTTQFASGVRLLIVILFDPWYLYLVLCVMIMEIKTAVWHVDGTIPLAVMESVIYTTEKHLESPVLSNLFADI